MAFIESFIDHSLDLPFCLPEDIHNLSQARSHLGGKECPLVSAACFSPPSSSPACAGRRRISAEFPGPLPTAREHPIPNCAVTVNQSRPPARNSRRRPTARGSSCSPVCRPARITCASSTPGFRSAEQNGVVLDAASSRDFAIRLEVGQLIGIGVRLGRVGAGADHVGRHRPRHQRDAGQPDRPERPRVHAIAAARPGRGRDHAQRLQPAVVAGPAARQRHPDTVELLHGGRRGESR